MTSGTTGSTAAPIEVGSRDELVYRQSVLCFVSAKDKQSKFQLYAFIYNFTDKNLRGKVFSWVPSTHKNLLTRKFNP